MGINSQIHHNINRLLLYTKGKKNILFLGVPDLLGELKKMNYQNLYKDMGFRYVESLDITSENGAD